MRHFVFYKQIHSVYNILRYIFLFNFSSSRWTEPTRDAVDAKWNRKKRKTQNNHRNKRKNYKKIQRSHGNTISSNNNEMLMLRRKEKSDDQNIKRKEERKKRLKIIERKKVLIDFAYETAKNSILGIQNYITTTIITGNSALQNQMKLFRAASASRSELIFLIFDWKWDSPFK